MIPPKLGTLEPVDLRQIWTEEARDFTPWLARQENLELLSDALSLELEFEGMEIPVGPYRVDIVAKEALTESRAVIENQLERTDHDHLGKVICYAAGRDETPEKSLLGSGLLLSSTEPATDDANNGGSSSGGRGANTDGKNKSNPDSSHNMARSSRNMGRSTLVHRIQN
jgi:hypothetical protein